MADWFELDSNLPSKPEVIAIRRTTRAEIPTIIGRLVMFWSLVDQHGDLLDESERPDDRPDLDGIVPGYHLVDLEDSIGGDAAFWAAVAETGWIAESSHGLLIPGFERRFSLNSKRRTDAAKRKQRERLREAGVIGTSPKPKRRRESQQVVTSVTTSRDKNVTTGQDRTGQDNPPPPTPSGSIEEREEEEGKTACRKIHCQGTATMSSRSTPSSRRSHATNSAGAVMAAVTTIPSPTVRAGSAEELAGCEPVGSRSSPERYRFRERLLAQGVTAPDVLAKALRLVSPEHLDQVITWGEQHWRPKETPDGPLRPFGPGVWANRITQPGRAELPASEGWAEPDPDWQQAETREREKRRRIEAARQQIAEREAKSASRDRESQELEALEALFADEIAELRHDREALLELLANSPGGEPLYQFAKRTKAGIESVPIRRFVLREIERRSAEAVASVTGR